MAIDYRPPSPCGRILRTCGAMLQHGAMAPGNLTSLPSAEEQTVPLKGTEDWLATHDAQLQPL